MKLKAGTYLAAFGDSASLSLTPPPAVLVIGMMKYSSTIKNRY